MIAANSSFGNLIATAVFAAPEVAQARADLNAARANVVAAKKGILPQIGIEARSEANANTAVLAVRQPLWGAGKLRAAVTEAEAALRQAEANLEVVQLEAALRMIDAVGRWVESDASAEALAAVMGDYDETVDMVSRRLGQGVGTASEAELVAARRAALAADLASALATRDMARAALATLLGASVTDSNLRAIEENIGRRGRLTGAELDAAIAGYPALTAADAAIARADAAIASAKADRFPILSAVGEQQVSTAKNGDSQRVYIGLSANVGPGRATGNRIAAAEAQRESLIAAKSVRARALRDELVALDTRYTAAQARLDANDRAIEASVAVLQSYRTQMSSTGGRSWQDVLGATREVADARRNRAVSKAELVTTYWKLRAYTLGLAGL